MKQVNTCGTVARHDMPRRWQLTVHTWAEEFEFGPFRQLDDTDDYGK